MHLGFMRGLEVLGRAFERNLYGRLNREIEVVWSPSSRWVHEYVHQFLPQIVVSIEGIEYGLVCLSLAQCSSLKEVQSLVDVKHLERSLAKSSL